MVFFNLARTITIHLVAFQKSTAYLTVAPIIRYIRISHTEQTGQSNQRLTAGQVSMLAQLPGGGPFSPLPISVAANRAAVAFDQQHASMDR